MSQPLVLSLCDRTGFMVEPWAAAGFECVCLDLSHPGGERREGLVTWVGADVRWWLPPRVEYRVVFAFPPCTNLAISGARWFKDKGLRGLTEGLELVERCRAICEWSGAPWMLENPVSTLSSYWREPDYTFNPCDFGGYLEPEGDHYTKRTCLWAGNGFTMPPERPVYPHNGSQMHLLAPSPERADRRSETPRGFARAVFEHMNPAQVEAA